MRQKSTTARSLRRTLALIVATAAVFAVWAAPASAIYSHDVVDKTFEAGPGCNPYDIALDEAHEWIYVSCASGGEKGGYIERYGYDGLPADFDFVAPYIEANKLIADPGGQEENFNFGQVRVAVDNSDSLNKGRLFVTSSPNIDVFNPTGKYGGAIVQPVESSIENILTALDVGPDGSIYVGSGSPGARISKYSPAFEEVRRLYGSGAGGFLGGGEPGYVKVDSTGAAWYSYSDYFGSSLGLVKFEEPNFTEELGIPSFAGSVSSAELAPFVAKRSPFMQGTFLFQNNYARYDIDLNTNDLYVAHEGKIKVFTPGSSDEAIHETAPAFGANTTALAYSKASNKIYASENNKIKIYGAGDIIPDVRTFKPDISDVGHDDATVRGRVELAGGEPITSCRVQYGRNAEYTGPGSGEVPCEPNPSVTSFSADTDVSAHLTGLQTGATFHYRFVAGNGKGTNFGIDRTVVPAYVLQLRTLAATGIDTEGAQLNASFDPDKETSYFFEYGIDDKYGLSIPIDEKEFETVPGGGGVVQVSEELRGLPSGKAFHYRVVAFNSDGATQGPDQSFRVGSSPDVSGVRTSELTETSATLHANINPVGFDTKYEFQYGTSPSYGSSAPIPPTDIGAGTEGIDVDQEIKGLQPGVTYHFRVVATNQWGPSYSPDTTFDFSPPACPNNHVRQQSGSSYLPDCRAYELVSPGAAGAVLLYPTNTLAKAGEGEDDCCENITSLYYRGFQWALNRGFADAPSRFAFYGGVGVINGLNAPTSESDIYMSTRTNGGWKTTVPGLTANESAGGDQRQCSESMELCIDHQSSGDQGRSPEDAPYLYTYDGKFKGRLPTNLGVVPGGANWGGFQRMSGNFAHFLFSSGEYRKTFEPEFSPGPKFTPDGLTTGAGSAYDNDLAQRTVQVISRLPGGGDIPTDVGKTPKVAIDFPGVSPDGSHVLMMTSAGGPQKHLYMSVNDLLHYEITQDSSGNPVTGEVIGMTRNGEKVLFASKAKVTADDHDNSTDIFMWDEATESNTLISVGNGAGNSDSCNASWEPSGCGARFLTPERAHPDNNAARGIPTAQDDLFAEDSGDVYFYSSEILDGSKPGIPNQKNLYVFRHGQVHLVATLDPGTSIQRVQISPNGDHAAFMTKSRLTSYDNKGFASMYTYDADTGELECASCNPSGIPPTSDVIASQGGRFMADDGKTFFSTKDQLVPRDRNGKIIDVYEYVDGRPQLITSGLAGRDFTGGSEVISFLLDPEFTGLEAVSRDGTDVYFSTFETLVGADQNGQFVKFYDARAGGGFDESPQLAPCAAADECHGTDSNPPAPPVIATGESAPGGNVLREKQKRKKHKKKGKHKKAKRQKKKGQGQTTGANHG